MVSLLVFFYILVIIFSIIGVIRGWAKEMLVTFAVILAFFLINVSEMYIFKGNTVDFVTNTLVNKFWTKAGILLLLVFFGYQTPRISLLSASVTKNKLSDSFLGFFLGGINGYLIVGSLWYYLKEAGYPFSYFINPETLLDVEKLHDTAQAAIDFAAKLPPEWLGAPPGIYIAVGLAFLFVMVVFL